MVGSSKRKEFISEGDIATLLQRYDTITILKLLQEISHYAERKMDWNELVKKTTTGITNAREYQLLWRHLAYRDSLHPVEDDARLPDDDSDMECELEASPAVNLDAVAEAIAHVKVMAASYVPSDSDIPEDSTVEAPLTINIPYVLHRGPEEPSDSYWSSRGMNITFPVLLQKAADGHNGNGLASSVNPRKRRRKWTAEEEEELVAAVKQHGEGSWAIIANENFEGERTAAQLTQRWGAIKKRCETLNSSTQSGLQRTEAQVAANRALSLAVGDRVPSKKLSVGISPMHSTGSIMGPQANGANGGSSLQGQQKSHPVVQALPRAATLIPTAKSRVIGKKTTANSTSRAELMVTTNSAAAAACMPGLASAASVPKVEPVKNTVAALVPKGEPVKTASAASLPRPSVSLPAPSAEPLKTTAAASLPRPSGILPAETAVALKSTAAASLPRPSGIIPAQTTGALQSTAAASLPRPSGILPAQHAGALKSAPPASLPRPTGILPAQNVGALKSTPAFSPRPAPKSEPVKPVSTASLPRPSSILSAPKPQPLKNVATAVATKTQPVGPSNVRQAVNGSPNRVVSSSPSIKPSPMAPLSKGPTIQNKPAPSSVPSSRLAPTQRVPTATAPPQKQSTGASVTASCNPVDIQKAQTQGNKATPTLQPNKTTQISTGKLVGAKFEPHPSLLPKKIQVPGVTSCTDKSSLNKPPGKETTTVSPLVRAETGSKPKDGEQKGL